MTEDEMRRLFRRFAKEEMDKVRGEIDIRMGEARRRIERRFDEALGNIEKRLDRELTATPNLPNQFANLFGPLLDEDD